MFVALIVTVYEAMFRSSEVSHSRYLPSFPLSTIKLLVVAVLV